jgi:hypothetical protein
VWRQRDEKSFALIPAVSLREIAGCGEETATFKNGVERLSLDAIFLF